MGRLDQLIAQNPHAGNYAVVDAAILDGLLEPMYALGARHFSCLLMGHIEPDVAHVAPYLLTLAPDSPMLGWLEARLDRPWGYFIESDLGLMPLQLHLRQFSETRGCHGEVLLFRFWDPRVARSMTEVLTPAQGETFMRGLSRLRLLQAESGNVTDIRWDAAAMKLVSSTESLPAAQEQPRIQGQSAGHAATRETHHAGI